MTADTLPKLLLEASRKWSDRVAIRQKDFGLWQEITWREYYQHAHDFGMGLISLGLKPGDKTCIQAENTQEWLYADLGNQCAGGVTVGVYPTNPPDELRYIMENSGARFFVAENEEHLEKILAVRERVPNLQKIIVMNMKGAKKLQDPMILGFKEVEVMGRELAAKGHGLLEERIMAGKAEDPGVFIYTSGTTGYPKGVVITNHNAIESTKCMQQALQFTENENHLSYLPLCHAVERNIGIHLHLLCGFVVNFAESIDSVTRDLQEIAPTFFGAVPRILEKIQAEIIIKIDNTSSLKKKIFFWGQSRGREIFFKKLAGQKLSLSDRMAQLLLSLLVQNPIKEDTGLKRARWVFAGGAAVSNDLVIFFNALGIPLMEMFGMTELSCISTIPYDKMKLGSAGKPFPGMAARIAEDGEILFQSPGVFKEYWGMPEATAEVKVDGWLHTGDLGEIDEDGHLKIVGRKKDIIITSGGKNVSPQFIESKLKISPFIREAMVIGDGRKYLTALVQIETDVVGNWAQNNGIAYTTLRDLSRRPEIVRLVQAHVDEVNSELNRVEQIKKFCLIDRELYHEEGDVTPTQKMKRSVMEIKFKDLIESMYGDRAPQVS